MPKYTPLKVRGVRGVMKNAMDAEQTSNRVLEITPFYPPYFKGEGKGNNLYFEDSFLR